MSISNNENALESKIFARVRKMMAIANDSAATEHERDTALKMVYNVLAKHNLSMADMIESEECGHQQEPREGIRNKFGTEKWKKVVCNSIAKLFFCKFYTHVGRSSKDTRSVFIGRQSNVATASLMSEYVISSIKDECKKKYGTLSGIMSRSFCVGASDAIYVRVNAMMVESLAEESTGTALVVVNLRKSEMQANDDWLASNGITLHNPKTRQQTVSSLAYGAGKVHGNEIGLNAQLNGGRKMIEN